MSVKKQKHPWTCWAAGGPEYYRVTQGSVKKYYDENGDFVDYESIGDDKDIGFECIYCGNIFPKMEKANVES